MAGTHTSRAGSEEHASLFVVKVAGDIKIAREIDVKTKGRVLVTMSDAHTRNWTSLYDGNENCEMEGSACLLVLCWPGSASTRNQQPKCNAHFSQREYHQQPYWIMLGQLGDSMASSERSQRMNDGNGKATPVLKWYQWYRAVCQLLASVETKRTTAKSQQPSSSSSTGKGDFHVFDISSDFRATSVSGV
eukprot:scaffold3670_cov124-Cylindrotheca_fusiformis.AAC.35